MKHRDKIASRSNPISILLLGLITIGFLISIAIFYSGLRVNFYYANMLESAVRMKTDISNARVSFLEYSLHQNEESIRNMWQFLDIVEFNSKQLLSTKEKFVFIDFTNNDQILNERIQRLQVDLLNYRSLSSKMLNPDSLSNSKARHELELMYEQVANGTYLIEEYFKSIIGTQIQVFRVTQYGLMAAILTIGFFALYFYSRSQKEYAKYTKKITEIKLTAETGMRKATMVEGELLENRRKFNTLIDNLPGMVYKCKGTEIWSFEYVSDKCQLVTGYKASELTNNNTTGYFNIINPEDFKKVFQQVQKAVEEKKPFQLIYRIKTAIGYEKWVWEQGSAIFSENDDELVGIEGFITDITEQKVVEDQLLLQSKALEAAANAIMITDKTGSIVWCNTAFTNLTGYDNKEILGKNPSILKSGVHSAEFYELMWKTISEGNTWKSELINKRKDGTKYDEEIIITPVQNASGQIEHFVAIKQDISERKKAEIALRESELRFRGLFENATIGIYRSQPDGKIVVANPTLLKISGYDSLADLYLLNAKDLYADPETRELFVNELERKGQVYGLESRWVRKDGLEVYIRESARVSKDEAGNIIYYEGTVEDISDKKLAEKILIEAKERAEQSDRLKSEFLAQMSHEIRTPLNVIMNFTDILKEELEDKVDDEMRESFDVISEEGKRIMRTVELILNMSELQTGSYSYQPSLLNLNTIVKKIHKDFMPLTVQKKIDFNYFSGEDVCKIDADEHSVNQIFYHLIDNAIKYTSSGKVDITIKKNRNNSIQVDVSDTGIGISDEYMQMLFQPFTKEEKGYTRNFEGNGLGLALVKRYCELNNAEISVSSKKGIGSIFRVTFHT